MHSEDCQTWCDQQLNTLSENFLCRHRPPGKLLGLSSTHDAHIGPKKLLSSLQSLERDTLLILNTFWYRALKKNQQKGFFSFKSFITLNVSRNAVLCIPTSLVVKYQQVSQVSCAAGISVIVAVYQLDSEECKTEKANQTKHFCHLYH